MTTEELKSVTLDAEALVSDLYGLLSILFQDNKLSKREQYTVLTRIGLDTDPYDDFLEDRES